MAAKISFDTKSQRLVGLPYKPGEVCVASVKRLLQTVDGGLIKDSVGNASKKRFCVESAVAYALGYPFNDQPPCVDRRLVNFKININDRWAWEGAAHRARGMRRLAVAQLGTNTKKFRFPVFKKELDKRWKERAKGLPLYCAASALMEKLNLASKKQDWVTVEECLSRIYNNFCGSAGKWADYVKSRLCDHEYFYNHSWPVTVLDLFCEDAVQVLIKMKTPGSKFLYLTK